jgi:hypothetical protein
MQDDDNKLVDRDCVICTEEYQMVFWTDHFKISRDILLEVIERVGPKVADISADLTIHHP